MWNSIHAYKWIRLYLDNLTYWDFFGRLELTKHIQAIKYL